MLTRKLNIQQNSIPQKPPPQVYMENMQRGPQSYPPQPNPQNFNQMGAQPYGQFSQPPPMQNYQRRSSQPLSGGHHIERRQVGHNMQHQPPQSPPYIHILQQQQQQYPTKHYTQQNDNDYDQQYHNHEQQYNHQDEQGDNQNSQQQDPDAQHKQVLLFWQHKFFTIFQRFQIIHEKVEWMRTEFYNLNNQLKAVDSENQWNLAKEHHDDYMEQIQQFSQELAGVLNQNITLYQQQQRQNDEEGIWRQRYYQLFQSYKNLELEVAQLRDGNQPVAQPNHNNQNSEQHQQKMQQLIQAYRQLQKQYTNVVSQLKQVKQSGNDNEQLNQYRQRLDYTLNQAEKYKAILDRLHEQNQDLGNTIAQIKAQNQELIERLQETNKAGNHDKYAKYQKMIESKDAQFNQLSGEMNSLRQQFQKMFQDKQSNQNKCFTQIKQLDRDLDQKIQQVKRLKKQLQSKDYDLQQKTRQIRNLEIIKLDVQKQQQKNKALLTKIDQKQQIIKSKNKQVDTYILEFREKKQQIRDLTNQLERLKIQIVSMQNRKKNTTDKHLAGKQFEARLRIVEQQYDTKLLSLKKIIKQKQESTEMNALTLIKLETLEKKNKTLLNQIQKLNKQSVERDRELLEYRRSIHQNQKMKQLQYQFHHVLDQKQGLTAAILQKNLEIDNLQNQLSQFEERIQTLGNKSNSLNSKSLILQIQELNTLLHQKQSENNKLRSSSNLKESMITELEIDLEKIKTSYATKQRQQQHEKEILHKKIKDSERKNQQSQKKIRQLEYDYGSKMKSNLEEQIRSLRSQNQAKQQNIMRLEADQLELQSKIAHYERIRGNVSTDIENMANKIRQMENNKIQMIKKVENAYRDLKKKDKQMKQMIESQKYLKLSLQNAQNKFKETQKMADEKQKIIKQLESQLLVTNSRLTFLSEEHDKLRMRRRNQTDVFVKQSEDLKRRLYQVESNSAMNFKNQGMDYNQQKIKQLLQEKQFLKSELANALQHLAQAPQSNRLEQSGKKSKLSKGSEGIDYIQKRLFEFNGKIDKMIVKNKQLKKFNNKNSGISYPQTNQQSQIPQIYQNQIEGLKNYIQQLRKYCSKLQVQAQGEVIRPNPQYSMIFAEQQKTNTDRYNFYVKQNQQLQNRIQKLLQINNGLKQRINSLLREQNHSNSQTFYNNHYQQTQLTIQNLNTKINKLSQQNMLLKTNNNDYNMKMYRAYQDRIFQCQNKMFELQRKITTVQVQKNTIESEKLTAKRDCNVSKAELQACLKRNTNKQQQNQQLRKRVQNLETEASQLLSKVRSVESQNKRLMQNLQSPYSQQQIYLSSSNITPNRTPKREYS